MNTQTPLPDRQFLNQFEGAVNRISATADRIAALPATISQATAKTAPSAQSPTLAVNGASESGALSGERP